MNNSNVPVEFELLDDMDIVIFGHHHHDIDAALAAWKMMKVRGST